MSDDAQQPEADGEALSRPEPAPPSTHDQQTVTSMPAMGDWPPAYGPAHSVGSTPPAASAPPVAPWATPAPPPQASGAAYGGSFAAPPQSSGAGGLGSTSANPFAAPDQAVPPPPIAPDGPGQVPYGYPGGYGYPGPGASPQQAYYGWGAAMPMPSNGLGTAGLVLGIIAAAGFCLWPVAILLGVLAVIFGAVGRAKAGRGEATNPGQALAGIICGIAGIVLGVGFGLLVLFA